MKSEYVPAAGHIIWIDFDPQTGREQAGRRPALVLSLEAYNRKTDLVVCCPITSKQKGYPFEVSVSVRSSSGGITGVVLADQVRSVDWRKRRAEPAGVAGEDVIKKVKQMLAALLQMPE